MCTRSGVLILAPANRHELATQASVRQFALTALAPYPAASHKKVASTTPALIATTAIVVALTRCVRCDPKAQTRLNTDNGT